VAAGGDDKGRSILADLFRRAEYLLYVAVAVSLAVAGLVLFVQVLYEFVNDVVSEDVAISGALLKALDGLLLVFIITELLHTVTSVISENVLSTEPFLVVGIVAAIRRVIVATAEAGDSANSGEFKDLMLEIGVLFGGVVALGATIFLLRHTHRQEPIPAGEQPDSAGEKN